MGVWFGRPKRHVFNENFLQLKILVYLENIYSGEDRSYLSHISFQDFCIFSHSPRYSVSHNFFAMILHLSLFRIQTFHGAHTDTSFLHAAILRIPTFRVFSLTFEPYNKFVFNKKRFYRFGNGGVCRK